MSLLYVNFISILNVMQLNQISHSYETLKWRNKPRISQAEFVAVVPKMVYERVRPVEPLGQPPCIKLCRVPPPPPGWWSSFLGEDDLMGSWGGVLHDGKKERPRRRLTMC